MSWSRIPAVDPPPLVPAGYSELDQITDSVITQIADRLMQQYMHPDGRPLILSPQEIRIATMMGRGISLKDIARAMSFHHPSDVGNRVRTCCRKHSITRHQLAVYGAFLALRKGEL